MRWIARTQLTRTLVPVLIGALVLPLVISTAGIVIAQAPEVPRFKVTVLDFEIAVETDIGESMLSRMATDQAVLALVRSGVFEVIPREDFYEAAKDIELEPPFDSYDLENIAARLELDAVVLGKITSIRYAENPRRAIVEMETRVYDVQARENIMGARVTGEGRALPGYVGPDLPLLRDAVINACDKAAATMAVQRTPLFTVGMVDDTGAAVVPNAGRQEGILQGMRLAVLRPEWNEETRQVHLRKLGRVRVSEVTAHDCTVRPLEPGLRLRNGDKLRLIAEPEVWGRPTPESKRQKWTNVLLTVAAVLLILNVFDKKAAFQEGASGLSAATMSTGTSIYLSFGSGGIPTNVGSTASHVIGYEVHRSTQPGFGPFIGTIIDWVANPGQSYYVDRDSWFYPTVTFEVSEDGTYTYSYALADSAPSSITVEIDQTSYEGEIIHPGLIPGASYYYSICAISKRVQAEQQRVDLVVSDPVMPPVGPATCIVPPELISPANEAAGVAIFPMVSLTWETTAGADTYEVQISSSPTFPRGAQTWSLETDGGGPIITTDLEGGAAMLRTFNISSKFPPIGPRTLYWRIGARRSTDAVRPYPDGYVWSAVWSFRTSG